MDRMRSREELYEHKSNYFHEKQFSNFYFSTPQNKNIPFEKVMPRKQAKIPPQTSLEISIDSNEVGRIEEKFKYDEIINKCLFEYDKKSDQQKVTKNPE